MIAGRLEREHPALEILRWLALWTLAAAVAAACAAVPLARAEAPSEAALENCDEQLWTLLDRGLDRGRLPPPADQIAAWREADLPAKAEIWRQAAVAALAAKLADWSTVRMALEAAEQVEGAERLEAGAAAALPLVDFHWGLYERALAQEDARRTKGLAQLTSYTPHTAEPPLLSGAAASVHHWRAVDAFERALAPADPTALEAVLEAPLIAAPQQGEPGARRGPVRVEDFLKGLGLEDFRARAHLALSELHLERGWVERAEKHFAAAAATGAGAGLL